VKISEVSSGLKNVSIEGNVVEIGDIRAFDKFGKQGKVCNAKIKDGSGEITLTLWNEQVDSIKKGDFVRINNGYVTEFRGQMQISTGKFGSLEALNIASKDQGEGALAKDEKIEAEALSEGLDEPAVEKELTKDEKKEAGISEDGHGEFSEDVDIEEERVD